MLIINYNLSLGKNYIFSLFIWISGLISTAFNSKIFLKIFSLPQQLLTSSHIQTATLTHHYVQNTLSHIIVHQGVLHFSKYKIRFTQAAYHFKMTEVSEYLRFICIMNHLE